MDAGVFLAWIVEAARLVDRHVDHLTHLDAAIGDADHGINLRRGFAAAVALLGRIDLQTPGEALAATGSALIANAGGACGPLYGTGFREAAKTFGDDPEVSAAQLGTGLAAFLAGVQRVGAAQVGDKTMVDALAPAVVAYHAVLDSGGDLASAAGAAAEAAAAGAETTEGLQARRGRAAFLGPRSIGHEDPGAASTTLILRALATAVAAQAP
jgi:dihydroxyacetone kinase-like protein